MTRTCAAHTFGRTGLVRVGLACTGALLAGACATAPRPASAAGPGEEWPALNAWHDAPTPQADSASEKEELAKQLNNPVADLISVPFQLNYDHDIGVNDDGNQWKLNVQPVIPMSLSEDWNLISRTILPLYRQEDFTPDFGTHWGPGDITQSFFFSPKKPVDGTVWGAGPVFLLPLASQDTMGGDKWGIGPTAVVLKQDGPWTLGALGNHIWSVAGDDDRPDIDSTYLQPFVAYTTKDAVSYSLNSESTYDWKTQEWEIPFNAVVSKVTRIGSQLVSIGGGLRWYADSTPGGPEGLGVRLVFTLLYPRR
ncbi:MAG TPA: transporter [Planctomycetota bacterium]|nr:transporter [Planctomycetota bacterium]